MGLVLAEEQEALGLAIMSLGADAPQDNVEAAGLERVHLVWEGDDHPVTHATHDEHCLGLPHSDVGDEALGPFLTDLSLCSRRLGLQLEWSAGERRWRKT